MAVAVKSNLSEDSELICGISNDCVVLQPAKLEPEPVNFVNVNNGMYEAATDMYCQSTYQQLTSCETFSNDAQVRNQCLNICISSNIIFIQVNYCVNRQWHSTVLNTLYTVRILVSIK